MRASVFVVATGALLASASPIQKRAVITNVVTEVVTEVVTVTVLAGQPVPTLPPAHAGPPAVPLSQPESHSEPSKSPAPPSVPVHAALPEANDYPSSAVKQHNLHRFNHSADALEWSEDLAVSARNLANKCVFRHETDGFGQNIAMWGSSRNAAALGDVAALSRSVTDQWYDSEFEKYCDNWDKDVIDMSNFEGWGHMTQMLWKSTRKVGCASVLCPSGTMVNGMDSWFTVCNYSPAGNMANEYKANVGLPLGHGSIVVK